MLPLPKYHGTSVGVLGLGPEGLACAEALNDSGARVIAWDGSEDRRQACPLKISAPINWPVEDFDAIVFADGNRGGASRALVERAKAAKVPILNELDLFAQAIQDLPIDDRPKVIAVTGAAGKSVAVSLIDHILRDAGKDVAIGGAVGVPMMKLPTPNANRIYVLELSIRRLSTTRGLHADISLVLNVASGDDPDQIEMAFRSILRILKPQGLADTAIVGVDDALGQKICTMLTAGQLKAATMGKIIPFSGESALSNGVFALEGVAYSAQKQHTTTLGDFSRARAIIGPHFQRDAAAAIATCINLGVASELIIKSLHSYSGLEGRFEALGSDGRVLFVDDSFASSATAARSALTAMLDVFWIGGDGMAKADLVAVASKENSVHGAYLVGDGTLPSTRAGHGQDGKGMFVTRHSVLQEAVAAAYQDACELAENDPDATPVVLCAPGVPVDDQRFAPDAFRGLISHYLAKEDSHAP